MKETYTKDMKETYTKDLGKRPVTRISLGKRPVIETDQSRKETSDSLCHGSLS